MSSYFLVKIRLDFTLVSILIQLLPKGKYYLVMHKYFERPFADPKRGGPPSKENNFAKKKMPDRPWETKLFVGQDLKTHIHSVRSSFLQKCRNRRKTLMSIRDSLIKSDLQ